MPNRSQKSAARMTLGASLSQSYAKKLFRKANASIRFPRQSTQVAAPLHSTTMRSGRGNKPLSNYTRRIEHRYGVSLEYLGTLHPVHSSFATLSSAIRLT